MIDCVVRIFNEKKNVLTELPVASPLIHGILRSLSIWQDLIKDDLANRGPAPNDFIPGKSEFYLRTS